MQAIVDVSELSTEGEEGLNLNLGHLNGSASSLSKFTKPKLLTSKLSLQFSPKNEDEDSSNQMRNILAKQESTVNKPYSALSKSHLQSLTSTNDISLKVPAQQEISHFKPLSKANSLIRNPLRDSTGPISLPGDPDPSPSPSDSGQKSKVGFKGKITFNVSGSSIIIRKSKKLLSSDIDKNDSPKPLKKPNSFDESPSESPNHIQNKLKSAVELESTSVAFDNTSTDKSPLQMKIASNNYHENLKQNLSKREIARFNERFEESTSPVATNRGSSGKTKVPVCRIKPLDYRSGTPTFEQLESAMTALGLASKL